MTPTKQYITITNYQLPCAVKQRRSEWNQRNFSRRVNTDVAGCLINDDDALIIYELM